MPRARPVPKSSRRSGRWLAHTGRTARSRMGAGLTLLIATVATASMTCAGISSLILTRHWSLPARGQELLIGRDDPRLRQGPRRPQRRGRDRLVGQPFRRSDQNFGIGSSGSFITSMGSSAPVASPASASSARTTGIAWRPGAGPPARQDLRGLGRRDLESRTKPLQRVRAVVSGQGPGAGVDQQAYPHRGPEEGSSDWNNDPDDIRNLVDIVSRDRKSL